MTFEGGPFLDERRLRERLEALCRAGVTRSFALAQSGGGLQNYYKLTPLGFELACGTEAARPGRAFYAEVSPSLLVHTFRVAEAIVEILRACSKNRVSIERFIHENDLTFTAGDQQVQPDCFFRLSTSGRTFNLAFEIDNSTASIDSHAVNSIRNKLSVYHAYQELMLSQWNAGGQRWECPRFRVVFLTPTVERAYHILAYAADMTPSKERRLVYATTHENFVTADHPLHAPLFLDHTGNWQSLIDLHPTAPYVKAPVRLTHPVESLLPV